MVELGRLRRRLLRADRYNIQLRYMDVAAESQVFFRFAATRSTGKLASSSVRRSESAWLWKVVNDFSAWSSKYLFGIVG